MLKDIRIGWCAYWYTVKRDGIGVFKERSTGRLFRGHDLGHAPKGYDAPMTDWPVVWFPSLLLTIQELNGRAMDYWGPSYPYSARYFDKVNDRVLFEVKFDREAGMY